MKTEKIHAALYNDAYRLQQKFSDEFFNELGLYLIPPPRWSQEKFIESFIIWLDSSGIKIRAYAEIYKDLSFVYWENELKAIKEAIEECEWIETQSKVINDFCEKMRAE